MKSIGMFDALFKDVSVLPVKVWRVKLGWSLIKCQVFGPTPFLYQRKITTEGILGQYPLSALGRTLADVLVNPLCINSPHILSTSCTVLVVCSIISLPRWLYSYSLCLPFPQSNSTYSVKVDDAISSLCACLELLTQPVSTCWCWHYVYLVVLWHTLTHTVYSSTHRRVQLCWSLCFVWQCWHIVVMGQTRWEF